MVYYGLFDEADAAMLRKCAVFYLAVAGEAGARGFSFEKPDKITAQVIKKDLLPMIRSGERFDFASAKERVSVFLTKLLTLGAKEAAFLERF